MPPYPHDQQTLYQCRTAMRMTLALGQASEKNCRRLRRRRSNVALVETGPPLPFAVGTARDARIKDEFLPSRPSSISSLMEIPASVTPHAQFANTLTCNLRIVPRGGWNTVPLRSRKHLLDIRLQRQAAALRLSQ